MDTSGNRVKKNITELALAGLRWRLYSNVSVLVLHVAVGIDLARLLPPEAYGLFLYPMIFIGLISVYAQAGIWEAIVQRQTLSKEHIEAGSALSLLISASATLGLWMLAPIIMRGAESTILRAASLSFVLSGFGIVSQALMEKELKFRQLFWVELVSYGGQGVTSIILALMGFGAWSLVYSQLLYVFTKSMMCVLMRPHPIGVSIKKDIAKELMYFGLGRSLATFANYSAQNGDYLVIGRLLPPEALGLYSRAFQAARLPASHLASVITRLLFPVYAAVQNDKQKLKKGLYLSVSFVSFVMFPLMVWLFIAAKKLIPVLYGPEWNGSIRSFQVLLVSGALGSIYTLCDTLVVAKGLVYAQFARHSVYAGMVIMGAVLGVGHGIEGVAFAVLLAVVIMYILMAQLSIDIVDGTWHEFLRAQVPGVVVGISVAVASSGVLLFGNTYLFADLIVLLALILSFAAIYPIALAYFPMSCLGEIPEFLFLHCSSLFPRLFLKILSRRLSVKVGTDVSEDAVRAICTFKLYDGLKKAMRSEAAKGSVLARLARRAYGEALMLNHVLRDSLVIHLLRGLRAVTSTPAPQSPLSWNVKIGEIRNVEDLKGLLRRNDILFAEGGHTIYIPPQPRLEQLFDKLVTFYPSDAGFKILKHFESPERAIYLENLDYGIDGHPFLLRILTGSVRDRVDAANVMHMFEIGPAIYDVAEIIANETVMTCFVVQHVDGISPTAGDHTEFLEKLNELINDGTFALVPSAGLKDSDFKSPDCNGNLIRLNETGKLMYVDFEQFIVRKKKKMMKQILSEAREVLRVDGSRLFRRDKYLYQSILRTSSVSKRDIDKRWPVMREMLHDSGIDVAGRIVLDIGCNAGMMMSCALANGALWGIGWDIPNVVEQAKRLNTVLGNTRLSFCAAKISEVNSISKDIPERFKPLLGESIVFCLAVWKHIGFISELAKIPWKAVVFEGYEEDTFENLSDIFLKFQSEWNCTVSIRSEIRDGDCGRRPIAVLVRGNKYGPPGTSMGSSPIYGSAAGSLLVQGEGLANSSAPMS